MGKGPDAEYEDVLADAGVDDKRLWVVESEFASVLRVAQRDGNTLTAIVRRAWDRGDIRLLTKNNPARAAGAHISIVGHVSRDELLRYLDPWWTFFQVPPESVNEWEQELVGLIRSFGPRVCEQAVCV